MSDQETVNQVLAAVVTPEAAPALVWSNGVLGPAPLHAIQTSHFPIGPFLSTAAGHTAATSALIFAVREPKTGAWALAGSGVLLANGLMLTAGHVASALIAPGAAAQHVSHPEAWVFFDAVGHNGQFLTLAQLDHFRGLCITGAPIKAAPGLDVALMPLPHLPPGFVLPPGVAPAALAAPTPNSSAMLIGAPDPTDLQNPPPQDRRVFGVLLTSGALVTDVVSLRATIGAIVNSGSPQSHGVFAHRINSYNKMSGGGIFDVNTGALVGLNIHTLVGANTNYGVNAPAIAYVLGLP